MYNIDAYQLTPEEIADLLPAVRAGDKAAKEKMILAHGPMVRDIAKRYVALWSVAYLWEDMISEGLVQVAIKIEEISDGLAMQNHDNISGFLRIRAFHAIGDWISMQQNIGTPKTQKKHAAKHGETLKIQSAQSVPCPEGEYYEIDSHMVEVRDFLDSIPSTEEERLVMKMREEGCSFEDIGQLLTMASSTVHALLQDIYARYSDAERALIDTK